MARIHSLLAGANVCAFLDMLAWSELGPALLAVSDDGYNVFVGSTAKHPHLFASYASHPHIIVNVSSGLRSSATGRYQFLAHTWDALVDKLALPDFSPISQDRAAIELLRQCKAYPEIVAGHIEAAIHLARSIWASLPGAGYGQLENPLSKLVDAYNAALAKQKPDFSNVIAGSTSANEE